MRKRKKLRLAILLVLVIILGGCKGKNEVEEEVDYNLFTQTEDSHINEEDASSNPQEESEAGTESMEHILEERKEKNKNAIVELANLSESIDITGVEGKFVIEPAGNSFENSKGISEFSYLVCYDEQNQCSYYINYGIDDYIYQRKGNETTLLIQQTARHLQLWDNKLYFVHAEGIFMTGDILCYDLSSKQFTKVIEGENSDFYIDEDGIIFGKCELRNQRS